MLEKIIDKGKKFKNGLSKKVAIVGMAVASLGFGTCDNLINVPENSQYNTTIQGRLQDSETDTGSEGEVRAYKENSDGTYTLLDSDRTDADGRFTLSFNEKVPNFDLQARLMDGNVDKSYVRTINLPGENNSDFLVRAVPYTGLNGNTVETDIKC